MCFSVRSSRNCLAMPSDCGTETMTGILSWEAAQIKYRILLQASIAGGNEVSAACFVLNALIVAMKSTINSDGPATLFGFGGAILLERMCLSVRSSRNCLDIPSDCGT